MRTHNPTWEIGYSTYMVTLVGSPPKAEMYFCTQRRARRSARCGACQEDVAWSWEASRLTVLQAEIADSGIFDLLAREEAIG